MYVTIIIPHVSIFSSLESGDFVPHLFFRAGLFSSAPWVLISLPTISVEPLAPCVSLRITLLPCACEMQGTLKDWVVSFLSLCKVFLIYISVVSPNYHPFGFLFPLKLPFPACGLLRMFCWNFIKLTLLEIVNANFLWGILTSCLQHPCTVCHDISNRDTTGSQSFPSGLPPVSPSIGTEEYIILPYLPSHKEFIF